MRLPRTDGSSISGLHDGEGRETVADCSYGNTLSSLSYASMRWADLHGLCVTYGTCICSTTWQPPARIGQVFNPSRSIRTQTFHNGSVFRLDARRNSLRRTLPDQGEVQVVLV